MSTFVLECCPFESMMRRTSRTGFLLPCFLIAGLEVFRSVSQKVLLQHLVWHQRTVSIRRKTHRSKLEHIYLLVRVTMKGENVMTYY